MKLRHKEAKYGTTSHDHYVENSDQENAGGAEECRQSTSWKNNKF